MYLSVREPLVEAQRQLVRRHIWRTSDFLAKKRQVVVAKQSASTRALGWLQRFTLSKLSGDLLD